ncbi:DUF58 domain-containing protein [Deminuibacter soli]|uniref:DUF58 domain-containing protein n=2 Tax=Deminuibacter soli TaxID=2291815 RepID=A0A3E1NRT6_9BACT|nr:DUF58 domain-containing protein [Deminuibacter soli]
MAIKDLSLAAKTTISGFMAGINKSNVKGAGLEFSQYRSYQPGDDLRWLDWRMYARSDRYYIRESEIETSIAVRLVIDASASMKHRDGQFTKIEYARYVAACLGCLAHNQGDAVGLYVLQQQQVQALQPRKDPQHMARFYYQLEQIAPAGSFAAATQYKQLLTGETTRELLIVITDLYDRDGEIAQLLKTCSALRHEIIVLHLMGRNELEMDYSGYTALEDLETGEIVGISNRDAAGYRERMQQYLAAVRTQQLDQGIAYYLMPMNEPVDKALRDFLKQRNKIMR